MNHMSHTTHKDLAARLVALTEEAWDFVAHDKVESLARQFLSGVPWVVHGGHWEVARFLAREIVSMTPSMLGSTAFDRLGRGMKGRSPEEIQAAELLRKSQFMVGRLEGGRLVDLVTGQSRPLMESPSSADLAGEAVVGRFGVVADGRLVSTGMLLALDGEAQKVAIGYAKGGGRGAVRCAEAVYRHMVRRGMAALTPPEPVSPFDPDDSPLDALAAAWAAAKGEPGSGFDRRVRDLLGVPTLVAALISVAVAGDLRDARLAAAYRAIAARMLEFMAMREANGSFGGIVNQAAAEVDIAIRLGRCGPETRALFVELRARAEMAARRKPGVASGDLDKLVARIQALRAKTVEQGCTEQEALSAAEKVAELLDRYGLNVSELDLRGQACEGIGIETGRKRRGPIDDCVATIAVFFDCRVWSEIGTDGTLRYVFFGLPGDVQAAVYLHDLIVLAFAGETAGYQRGAFYLGLESGSKRTATTSFQAGLARGINGKLNSLRQSRATAGSNGRDLVPVKESIVEQELERLGLALRRASTTRRRVLKDAYVAGEEAGRKFEVRQGIEG